MLQLKKMASALKDIHIKISPKSLKTKKKRRWYIAFWKGSDLKKNTKIHSYEQRVTKIVETKFISSKKQSVKFNIGTLYTFFLYCV